MAVKEKKASTNQYSKDVEKFEVDDVKKVKSSKEDDSKKKEKDSKKKNTKSKDKDKAKKKSLGFFGSIKHWFKGVIKELKIVHWPSKKEMFKYSIATIVFVIFFSMFFLIIEVVVSFLLSYFG